MLSLVNGTSSSSKVPNVEKAQENVALAGKGKAKKGPITTQSSRTLRKGNLRDNF